jgi:predicted RNA-binding Zn-ribbon protein involved in translation (DUF1610 family)
MTVATFPCTSCGAELEFKPGTRHLICPYCRNDNEIPQLDEEVKEQDFESELAALGDKQEGQEVITVRCDSCRAEVPMAPNVTSQSCPFCGSNIVATGKSQKHIKPRSLLPFAVDRNKARDMFRQWLAARWFAPGKLKQFAMIDDAKGTKGTGLAGIYLPYWTYDCKTTTPYTGQRGDNYYVQVPVTVMVNGKPTTRMQQQVRTRWSWVSGSVDNDFDDVLVAASTSLPEDQLAGVGADNSGWDLKELVPYSDQYLAGFTAESYTVDLPTGFNTARGIMEEEIRDSIRSDIGGDHQRISEMRPAYRNITFKHILLPVWVAAYRYNNKVYRFLINARTGRIDGERPYSAWKIAFVVGLAIVAVLIIVLVANR